MGIFSPKIIESIEESLFKKKNYTPDFIPAVFNCNKK